MLQDLKKLLLATAQKVVMERTCLKCGQKFKPFSGLRLTSWSDFTQPCHCPHCGAAFSLRELMEHNYHPEANPAGPFSKPPESRIEFREDAAGSIEFHLPSAERWDNWIIWIFAPVIWGAITLPFFLWALTTVGSNAIWRPPFLFVSLLVPAVGLGLTYAVVRHFFSSTWLELNPGSVCFHRNLFGRNRSHRIPLSEVERVWKVGSYSANYQPLSAIEIKAGRRKIRFGYTLSEDEKSWLCWEIGEFVDRHRHHVPLDPAVADLTRDRKDVVASASIR